MVSLLYVLSCIIIDSKQKIFYFFRMKIEEKFRFLIQEWLKYKNSRKSYLQIAK